MTSPSDREVFLNEVREALKTEIRRQGDLPGGGYVDTSYNREHALLIDGGIDLTPLAQAAIDAMIRHMGPPF